MIARLGRLARLIDSYANAALVFAMLVGALLVIVGLGCALLGSIPLAAALIPAGLTVGAPSYCVLLARHINPEGHQK